MEFDWLTFDGDPIAALQMAGETRDLIVTGHDTGFYGNVREQISETLAQLLLTTPRPVVICGDEATAGPDLLIVYDGSVPAMKAIQMFALMGIGRGRHLYVLSIDSDKELAARKAKAAASYLRAHEYEVEEIAIASHVRPADVLRIEVIGRKIGTLVIGAYGNRGFREALFGSTTTKMVENPPCALYVYH